VLVLLLWAIRTGRDRLLWGILGVLVLPLEDCVGLTCLSLRVFLSRCDHAADCWPTPPLLFGPLSRAQTWHLTLIVDMAPLRHSYVFCQMVSPVVGHDGGPCTCYDISK
jgi:hypothetical protein